MRVWRPEPVWEDARGAITDLLDDVTVRHVGLVTSKAGTVRGNHIHQKADRYTYLLGGRMEYFEQAPEGKPTSAVLDVGSMVYTPAGTALAIRFLEDSTFLELNTEPRSQGRYEEEIVRLQHPLVEPS